MVFNGISEGHFYRLESLDHASQALRESYRQFASLTRHVALLGGDPKRILFPGQYSSELDKIDALIRDASRCFGAREFAEKELLSRGGDVLEIGVASGSHAISLIQNTSARSYCGIDINFDQLCSVSKEAFKDLGREGRCRIEFLSMDSCEALKLLGSNGRLFDTIYIDANHWYDYVSRELSFVEPLLKPGGCIVLNDYLEWFVSSMEPCGVIRAVNKFISHSTHKYEVCYFAFTDCDLALRRISS